MTWASTPGMWSRVSEQTMLVSLVFRETVAVRTGRRAEDMMAVGGEKKGDDSFDPLRQA
jgi:hypothetical protein